MSNRQILEEAGAWFVDFRLGDMGRPARREFMQWLRRSPDHIRAYMDISGAYARLPAPSEANATQVAALIGRTRARVSARGAEVTNLEPRREAAQRRRFFRRPAVLAASLFLACGAAALAAWLAAFHDPAYVTAADEQRAIILEDGSRMDMNVRTRVRVSFTREQRRIELLDGQAMFRVAGDKHRPFIVETGGARVRALGTRFDVYRRESGVTVSVLEGRVAVDTTSAGKRAELASGEQVVVTGESIVTPSRPAIAMATAWTQGEFEFDETPLAEVALEFNRYTQRRLVIESPELAGFRVTGVYASADATALIRFLRNQPGFIVTETDTDIRVSRK